MHINIVFIAGSIACVKGAFAQCVGGNWALTQCTSGLSCFALPLVNSPGTSIACDTKEDALARISASGASGGLTGSGNNTNSTTTPSSITDSTPTSVASSAASTPTSGNSNANTTVGGDSSTDTYGNSNANSTTGQTHGNDSNDGDCSSDSQGSPASNGSSTTSVVSSNMGGVYNGGNSTNTTGTTTDTSGIYSAMSEMASTAMKYASSTGYNQMYRRQFTPGSAVPTQTLGTGASLGTPATTPNTFGVSTVTLLMVSTVTVTASECQGNTNPTSFPSLSSAPSLSPTPTISQSNAGNAQTPFPTVTPITETTSISQNGALSTPTLSPSSNGTPVGGGGFSFTPQPSNGGPAAQPTNGASSNFNLSQLLTATI